MSTSTSPTKAPPLTWRRMRMIDNDALRYGLKRFMLSEEENFFFGAVLTTGFGVVKQIPFFAPDRDNLVEYDDPARWSHIRIATKYPEITRRHFAARGVQAECIKLNGAMELAPSMGLCRRIVDLVSTGATLAANDLVEVEHIAEVTSRLIVNRTALKTRADQIGGWIERLREAANAA